MQNNTQTNAQTNAQNNTSQHNAQNTTAACPAGPRRPPQVGGRPRAPAGGARGGAAPLPRAPRARAVSERGEKKGAAEEGRVARISLFAWCPQYVSGRRACFLKPPLIQPPNAWTLEPAARARRPRRSARARAAPSSAPPTTPGRPPARARTRPPLAAAAVLAAPAAPAAVRGGGAISWGTTD